MNPSFLGFPAKYNPKHLNSFPVPHVLEDFPALIVSNFNLSNLEPLETAPCTPYFLLLGFHITFGILGLHVPSVFLHIFPDGRLLLYLLILKKSLYE